jgi:hypothetical protein
MALIPLPPMSIARVLGPGRLVGFCRSCVLCLVAMCQVPVVEKWARALVNILVSENNSIPATSQQDIKSMLLRLVTARGNLMRVIPIAVPKELSL